MNVEFENGKQTSHNDRHVENSISRPLVISLTVIAIVFAAASSMTTFRKLFLPTTESRKILAKSFTEYLGRNYVIFKIKTNFGIDLEIYEKDPTTQQQSFKQRFSFNNDAEAFLMINNNAVNLGLVDINQDGRLDIIAPTVDKNGYSRLNVFQFDTDLLQFVPFVQVTP